MTQNNFETLASHPKYKYLLYFEIFNLALQCLVLAGSARYDSSSTPLDVNNIHDVMNNGGNISRKALEDAFRSSFGGGGENIYDIPLTIFPWLFGMFFEVQRKDKESSSKFNSKRAARIVGGISIIIAAFFINGWLKDLHKHLSQNKNVSKFALVLLQGFSGTLFSIMFVFGILMFALSIGSIIIDISKKLEKKTNKEGEEINRKGGKVLNGLFLGVGFVGFSIVMPAGFLLLSKKFTKLAEEFPKLATLYNFLSIALMVLSIVFGISIVGRRFLEVALKKKIIEAFPNYNKLLDDTPKKEDKKSTIAKLIGYALAWYGGLFLCYGMVFCCGEFLEKVLVNSFNLPEWIGIVGNNIINDLFYLSAILIGMQAIGCLLKVVNIMSCDKDFEKKIKAQSIDEVKSIHAKNNYKAVGLGAVLLVDTGLMIGLIALIAEKKIELSFVVPILILAFLTIGRVCMAFMTQAMSQNITIETAHENLFSKPITQATA